MNRSQWAPTSASEGSPARRLWTRLDVGPVPALVMSRRLWMIPSSPAAPRPARAVPDGILSPLVWPARVGPGRLLARTHLEGWRGEIDAGNDGDLGTPCCKRETLKRACCRVERPPGTSGDRPRLQP